MDTFTSNGITALSASRLRATAKRPRAICPMVLPEASPAAARALEEARELTEREGLVQVASSFRIRPVIAHHRDFFDLGGLSVRVPRFAPWAERIDAIAAGVCTIGSELEERASDLFGERHPSLGYALDSFGTETLYRLSDQILDEIRIAAREQGLCAGEQANPGDSGLAMGRQKQVLVLAEADACGVALTSSGMLSPRKSLSFLVALGRGLEEQTLFWRCRHCPDRNQCRLRR